MFTALTVKKIEFFTGKENVIIDEDTIISVNNIGGAYIGSFGSKAFDVSPDEYVKLSGLISFSTH